MGIVEKFIKEGQLTKEEYPELLHLYQDFWQAFMSFQMWKAI